MVFRLRPTLKIGWNSALRGTSLTLEKCPWPGDTRGAKEKEISMGHSKKKKAGTVFYRFWLYLHFKWFNIIKQCTKSMLDIDYFLAGVLTLHNYFFFSLNQFFLQSSAVRKK